MIFSLGERYVKIYPNNRDTDVLQAWRGSMDLKKQISFKILIVNNIRETAGTCIKSLDNDNDDLIEAGKNQVK